MTLSGAMTASLRDAARVERHAQLLWFDPGATTGVCLVSIRPRWLAGDGEPTWSGMRRALTSVWHAQIGRDGKTWSERTTKTMKNARPVTGREHATTVKILAGQGRHGGGTVSESLRNEVGQLLQQIALLEMWPDAAWGYESFVIMAPNASVDYASPLRINARIEAIELIYGERGRLPFVMAPSYAKSTATDERLKMAGLYRPGMDHATDAARHCATFLRDARQQSELRAQAWPRLFKSNIIKEESA